jgi:hypothetical protein
MWPKKNDGADDLFRAPLNQIINMKRELVMLAGKIDRPESTATSNRIFHPIWLSRLSAERA